MIDKNNKTVNKLTSIVKRWTKRLSNFERLLLILLVSSWTLVATFYVLGLTGTYLLNKVGDYRNSKNKEKISQLTPQLKSVESNIQLISVEVKPDASQDGGLILKPEYRLRRTQREETRLSCEVSERRLVTKGLNNFYERPPETELEKEYCTLRKQISSLQPRPAYYNFPTSVFNGLTSIALFFTALFLSVEVLKHTIRAALRK